MVRRGAMKALQELEGVSVPGPTVITVGVFDGVHLGHRHLFARLVEEARRHNASAVVVTFRNHPREVLRPGDPIPLLTDLERRLRLIRGCGVDLVVPLTFDLPLSRLSARDFARLLQERLRMAGLVVGPNFAMGHRRQGTPEVLRAMGREMGFTVTVVPPLHLEGGLMVSSSLVREALASGQVERAARMLGRYYWLEGTVVRGQGRGRDLGFPTANLRVDPGRAVPGNGIYATWAWVGGRRYMSATSIGVRPTFGPGKRTVEAHLLDFSGQLYGQPLALEFVARLRDEEAFPTVEALVQEMARDVERTRACLQVALTTHS